MSVSVNLKNNLKERIGKRTRPHTKGGQKGISYSDVIEQAMDLLEKEENKNW